MNLTIACILTILILALLNLTRALISAL